MIRDPGGSDTEKTGQPLVIQARPDGPLVNRALPDESRCPSRTKRTLKGLRLLTANVKRMETYCLIHKVNFADLVDRFCEAFLSGKWNPLVNQSSTCVCSVCKTTIEEDEHTQDTHAPARLVNQSLPFPGTAPVVDMAVHRSKFDRKTIEQYAACHDKDGMPLGKPWIDWACRTGGWDVQIEKWIEMQKAPTNGGTQNAQRRETASERNVGNVREGLAQFGIGIEGSDPGNDPGESSIRLRTAHPKR